MKSNVIDQPAEAGADQLGMDAYAAALTEFIRDAQSPLTIALQGEWGSGKTSLMNALKARLVEAVNAPFLGVEINTWQYALMSNTEEAIIRILKGIIGQIPDQDKTEHSNRKEKILKIVSSLGRTVAVGAANVAGSLVGAGQIGSEYSKVLDSEKKTTEVLIVGEESPIEKLKKQLTSMVADCCVANSADDAKDGKKCGILVFIDDLDRIDPPVAVQILELLKNVFDIPKCIFVLAIDYGVVVKGLKPKFGDMKAENEREFRSFFDKIIQLPFSMPVGNYTIDEFLKSSLQEIGYLNEMESKTSNLCEAISDYALQSVGTNPRSMKRLINYLSLIQHLIRKTPTKEDDADFASWKDVLFALVSLQIQYPPIYEALLADPDFPKWGEAFEQKWRIPALKEGEKDKLEKMTEFDERWEQILFRLCQLDPFLKARAINVSHILNRIKARIEAAQQPVGETVDWLMRLSAVTSVKSTQARSAVPEFNMSQFLKSLRGTTLGLKDVWQKDGTHGWEIKLPTGPYLSCWQGAVKKQITINMWIGCSTWKDTVGEFISKMLFRISHDGKSFLMKVDGAFLGDSPDADVNTCIDFSSAEIRANLAAAETAYCAAWAPFGIDAKIGENIGHYPTNIWWTVAIPFKNHDELVSSAFSQKLRGALTAVADAFAPLLKYRVPAQA